MMKILEITHYPKSDKKCWGDYWDVELQDEKGNTIAEFGDAYHDKGLDKAQGFIEGVSWAKGVKINVIRKNVADRED